MNKKNKLKTSNRGKKIKIRLVELEMSQGELAKAIGTSKYYINHIITGYRAGDKYMEDIENILGISLEGYDYKGLK